MSKEIINELKEEGLDMVAKHHGEDNFRRYLEDNVEICDFLFFI